MFLAWYLLVKSRFTSSDLWLYQNKNGLKFVKINLRRVWPPIILLKGHYLIEYESRHALQQNIFEFKKNILQLYKVYVGTE